MIRYFLFLCFLIGQTAFCQTKIDNLISIKFPYDPIEGNEDLQLYCTKGNAVFQINKVKMPKQAGGKMYRPTTDIELKGLYEASIENHDEVMRQSDLIFKSNSKFNLQGYRAYRTHYVDSVNGRKNAEMIVLYLSDHLYSFTYSNHIDFDREEKDLFFNSIEFNPDYSISQLTKRETFSIYNITRFVTGIVSIALIVFGLISLFRWIDKRKKVKYEKQH